VVCVPVGWVAGCSPYSVRIAHSLPPLPIPPPLVGGLSCLLLTTTHRLSMVLLLFGLGLAVLGRLWAVPAIVSLAAPGGL